MGTIPQPVFLIPVEKIDNTRIQNLDLSNDWNFNWNGHSYNQDDVNQWKSGKREISFNPEDHSVTVNGQTYTKNDLDVAREDWQ